MKPKILVVGDVMLDRYIHGTVERISPEAPIPILRQTHIEDRPGGAANVACNLVSLGAAHGWLIGGPYTAVKNRYVCNGHQMLRVDEDCPRPTAAELRQIDADVAEALGRQPAAMVLSDYAGGVLSQPQAMIQRARKAGIPVYVDPKGNDWEQYRGATLIKPNDAEIMAVVGYCSDRASIVHAGAVLLREIGIAEMLITHGAGGMTWVNRIGDFKHEPAVSGPVVDVTGAGDTVLACVAYLRAMGGDWPEVLRMAALGAAAVCARHGTSVVTLNDIEMA